MAGVSDANEDSYYRGLLLARAVSPDDIVRAYRRLALNVHPTPIQRTPMPPHACRRSPTARHDHQSAPARPPLPRPPTGGSKRQAFSALVAVRQWMVLRQPDQKQGGLVDKVRIQLLAAETGRRSMKRRVRQARCRRS